MQIRMRTFVILEIAFLALLFLSLRKQPEPTRPACVEVAQLDTATGFVYVRELRKDGTCKEYIIVNGFQIITP
jgi:hypothetical protein